MCPKVLANTAKSAWLRDDMVVVHSTFGKDPHDKAWAMGARGENDFGRSAVAPLC
jgi:hypothetical protein